jgi:hypothetical protein
MTTAPVAEAASSRGSSRVPDHAPEAFIRHDGKGIPANVVDSLVIMHLLMWWLQLLVEHQFVPLLRKSPSMAPILPLSDERGQGTKATMVGWRGICGLLDRSVCLAQ